jgi:hypothetical protein
MYNVGGNYWLNIILLDECCDALYLHLKPCKYQKFISENHLRMFITSLQNKFFNLSQNKKYLKFRPYIRLEFLIDITNEDGKQLYKIDSFSLKTN